MLVSAMRHRFSRQQSSFTAKMRNHWHWRPRATRPLSTPSPPDTQLLFRIEAVQLLVVHNHAFAFQHYTDPPITKPAAFVSNRLHLFAHFRIIWRVVAPDGLGIDTNKPARPTLRDVMIPHRLACRSPSHIRCRQFFPSKSFNTTLSNIVSANKRFNLAFSSVTARNFAASDTSMPPYWDLNL